MRRLLVPSLLIAGLLACGGVDGLDRGDTTLTTIATTTTRVAFTGGILGTVTAGPTCPVLQNPPDPACANRPVADARIIVFDMSGKKVAHTSTSEGGMFSLTLAPGSYEVVAEPVPGLMGLPSPVAIDVFDEFLTIELEYDTGIR
jgi:hypothetical protein